MLIIVLFNFIILDSLLQLDSYNFTFLEKNYNIESWLWQKIKLFYILIVAFNWSILFKNIYEKHIKTCTSESANPNTLEINKTDQLHLDVGICCDTNLPVIIPKQGLFQNILITGTIGTGKTSSAMYPFVEQLISQNIGMLVLDVKGNFHYHLKELAQKYNKKVTVIELRSEKKNTTY